MKEEKTCYAIGMVEQIFLILGIVVSVIGGKEERKDLRCAI